MSILDNQNPSSFKRGSIKLSEAIRIGSKRTNYYTGGEYFCEASNACCALGTAYLALEGHDRVLPGADGFKIASRLFKEWPWLTDDYNDVNNWYGEIVEESDRGIGRESVASWLELEGK